MSRSVAKPAPSTAKPASGSGKVVKPVPTAWKERLNGEDYDELKNTFDVFDEDGSGTIDPVEINKVLEELGLDRRNPFVLKLIEGLKEKNKPIGFEEFVDTIASKVGETKTKDGLKRVFALYDKDENGLIDFDEFKTIAKQIHDTINDDDLRELIHSTHVNQKTASEEGFTFDEFYSIVSKFANK
jgi:Ca2+-binding EF-hand superfamily protein